MWQLRLHILFEGTFITSPLSALCHEEQLFQGGVFTKCHSCSLIWLLLCKSTKKKEGYQCKYSAMHYLSKLWVGKEYLFLFCVYKCDFTPLDISLLFYFSYLFIYLFAMRRVYLHLTDKYDFFLSISTISATILCSKNAVNLKMGFTCMQKYQMLSNAGWRWTVANWNVDISDSLVDNYGTAARNLNISDLLSVVFVQLFYIICILLEQ